MEAMALILLQLFTWRECRNAFHKGILSVSSRDIRETDNSVGFDLKVPNFGWLLYSKAYVKRYLALVKYDRQMTVAPADDDYKKVSVVVFFFNHLTKVNLFHLQLVTSVQVPPRRIRMMNIRDIRADPKLRKWLTPPTQYLRWFLWAARVHIGRMEEAPEYLKQWQLAAAPTQRHGLTDNEEAAARRRQTASSDEPEKNVFASVLGIQEDDQDEF